MSRIFSHLIVLSMAAILLALLASAIGGRGDRR